MGALARGARVVPRRGVPFLLQIGLDCVSQDPGPSASVLGGILYGRVDLVMTSEGWAIMELELVEPSLFLAYDDRAPRRLAEAIRARLD